MLEKWVIATLIMHGSVKARVWERRPIAHQNKCMMNACWQPHACTICTGPYCTCCLISSRLLPRQHLLWLLQVTWSALLVTWSGNGSAWGIWNGSAWGIWSGSGPFSKTQQHGYARPGQCAQKWQTQCRQLLYCPVPWGKSVYAHWCVLSTDHLYCLCAVRLYRQSFYFAAHKGKDGVTSYANVATPSKKTRHAQWERVQRAACRVHATARANRI